MKLGYPSERFMTATGKLVLPLFINGNGFKFTKQVQDLSNQGKIKNEGHYKYQILMQNQPQNQPKTKEQQQDQQTSSLSHRFKQTILRAWMPIPTLPKTITLFFVLCAIFIGVGIPMAVMSSQITQVRIRYDNSCAIGSFCNFTFEIPHTMLSPVFVYYQLNGYYQNHRHYASSISNDQMVGKVNALSDVSTICQPIVKNSDLYVLNATDGTQLDSNATANPCGLIAYSIFNDTFSVFYPNGTNISQMTTNGISWPAYQNVFKISNSSQQWLNVTDPRFINWIRIAPLPNFRKLWARINDNLESGNYTVQIKNIYTVSQFGTSKYFVLSTTNFFGSKNLFLSIIYLVIGGLCFLVGILFTIRLINKKKREKK